MITLILISLLFVISMIVQLTYQKKSQHTLQSILSVVSTNTQKWLPFLTIGSCLTTALYPYVRKNRQSLRQKMRRIHNQHTIDQYDQWLLMQQCLIAYIGSWCVVLSSHFYSSVSVLLLFLTVFLIWHIQHDVVEKFDQYQHQLTMALPHILAQMILLLNAGQTLQHAFKVTAFTQTSALHQAMQWISTQNDNGNSFRILLHQFAQLTQQNDVQKFITICVQSNEKGSGEMITLFEQMLTDAWHVRKNKLIQQAQLTNQKLLIPAAIIFIGILISIIGPIFLGQLNHL